MNPKLTVASYQLELRHPFTISRYTVSRQKTVIVTLTQDGISGYGEATANPYYASTVERIEGSLSRVRHIIESSTGKHPSELWAELEPHLRDDYFALCALDCAYWDLYSRLNGRTMRSYWSTEGAETPLSNYTIGIDRIEVMQEKILEMPWPIYKIKLGTNRDLEIVKALRSITDAGFRIDANCAWSKEQTIVNSGILKELGVDLIEQPLPATKSRDMKDLKKVSPLPLVADESCQRFSDVDACAEGFHGINIKLMKCGGITPALKMIDRARELGLMVMAGCMTESTIGISNLAQLAPQLDCIDADGALLLKSDIATGVKLENGRIYYSSQPGSGVHLI